MKRDKKKIQAMEDAMQAKITELKKRQEGLRKGLENMAKEKGANNTEIVKQMDVNTTQLDSSSVQALINTIMPQHDAGEGCSGEKGPDKEDSEAEESDSGRSPENCLGENSPEEEEGERESDSGRSDEDVVALIITVQTERRVSGTATATTRASKVRESAKNGLRALYIINFRVTLFTNLRS